MTRLYISILSVLAVLAGVTAVLTGRLALAFCLLLAGYLCLAWLWSRDGLREVLDEASEAVKAEERENRKDTGPAREPEVKPAKARRGRLRYAGAAIWGLVSLTTMASAFTSNVNALSRLLMAAVAFVCILIAYNLYRKAR